MQTRIRGSVLDSNSILNAVGEGTFRTPPNGLGDVIAQVRSIRFKWTLESW